MITADGQSYLAFRKHAGVAVALGDPVGPPGSTGADHRRLRRLCDQAALVPYIFSCTGGDRGGHRRAGLAERRRSPRTT